MDTLARADPAYGGQAVYTRWFLTIYDALLYGVNSPLLWRCPKSRFIEHYDANVSGRHLDVGVATGILLDECRFPVPTPELTLMDLNRNSLERAAQRLARYAPSTHHANALESWGLPAGGYDSVGISNLLHCLPGEMSAKSIIFEHARTVLAPGGTLFGTTILGKNVNHGRLARLVLLLNNRQGFMSNLNDALEDLHAALARSFPSHEIHVQGAIALFTARAAP